MKVLDRTKKIKAISPIEDGGNSEIKQKEDLDNYVEEPLLEICRKLYDLNIQTVMSSANQGDIENFASIQIVYDTLSIENKEKLQMLSRNFSNKFEMCKNFRGQKQDVISVRMPITNPDTTAGEISDYFFDALQSLKIQDVPYGFIEKKDLKKKAAAILGCNEKNVTEQDCKDVLEYLGMEIEKDGKYYTKEALRRHEVYLASKVQANEMTDKSKE